MRSLFFSPLFLLPFFFPILDAADSMDCFGRNAICSQANDLYDGCNSLLDGDTDKWFACLCQNGYVATDEACNWCQLAYTSSPIYTDVAKTQCESNNVVIAPIPESIQSIASSFNATYTGFKSSSPEPTTSPQADASTTNNGVAAPPKTSNAGPSPTFGGISSVGNDGQSSETAAATNTPNTPTQTSRNAQNSPTSPAQTDPANHNASKSSSGLSTGAKAGIGIGCVLLVILILALIWIAIVLMRISKQRSSRNHSQGNGQGNGGNGPIPDYAVQGQGIQEMGDTSSKVSFWPWGGGSKHQQHQQQQNQQQYAAPPPQYAHPAPPQMQMQQNNMTPAPGPMNNNAYDQRRRSEMDGTTIAGTVQGSPVSPGVASPVSNASTPGPQMAGMVPPPQGGQQQYQAYQRPSEQQQQYFPPQQQGQGQYQAYQPNRAPQVVSELHGNEIHVPPGAGMPPEGR